MTELNNITDQFAPKPDLLDPNQFVPDHQECLLSLPLFAGLSYQNLESFLLDCEYRHLKNQDLLLSPGQMDNSYLYIILTGLLSAHIQPHEAEKGFRVLQGEFVGEVSLFDKQPPTSYVSAIEDTLLLCIPETVLWQFMLIPGAAKNLLQQITKRTRARNLSMQKSLENTLRLKMIEKELRIAQELQGSMLPQKPFFPDHSQIAVDALMRPAKEIGGDLYDAFQLDDELICIAIGDVSGKGIPAALFMARSITLLRTEMIKTKDLQQTIAVMNSTLSQDNPQCMFVTLMICTLNLHSGQLQYVNGGHNRALLGEVGNGFQYLAQPKGILVGINPVANYEMATRQLQVGDTLILYTDGITEANNPVQEEYGDQQLLDLLNQQQAEKSTVDDIVVTIETAVREFAAEAEQSDDLTLVVLRYLPG